MLKVLKIIPPSPEQFDTTFYGMRHAFKSYDKSDSKIIPKVGYTHENGVAEEVVEYKFELGDNDKRLALNLTGAGNASHRKFLRQLPIQIVIKAPLYWWKQMDRYQVGTTTNSESTMHCLTKDEFSISDFSFESCNLAESNKYNAAFKTNELLTGYDLFKNVNLYPIDLAGLLVEILNIYRQKFLSAKTQEEKKYFFDLINCLLPQSYEQTRTVSMNYEVAMQIIEQRFGHKLDEWHTLINKLLELPYTREFAGAAGLLKEG